MLVLILKSQLPLFDAPVQIAQHVRKDGTVVRPHMRIQKVAVHPQAHQRSLFGEEKPAPAAKRTRLDAWIAKRGGAAAVARTLAQLTDEQRERILQEMGKLAGGKTAAEVRAMLPEVAEAKPAQGDMFAEGEKPALAAQPAKKPSDGEILAGEIRAAVNAESSRPIGEPFPIKVTHRGTAVRFMARIDALARGKNKGAVHLMTIKRGRLLAGDPVGWLASYFVLTGKDEFRDDKRLPHIVTDDAAAKFAASFDSASTKAPAASDPVKLDSGVIADAPTPARVPVSDVMSGAAAEPTQAAERAAPFGVPAGTTKKQRLDINASVTRLVTSGATQFTDTEKALMRQYSGNGGCGDSLNEFYTDPAVATAMWDVLGKIGLTSGDVLEPSCGAGVYLHTAPNGIKVTGVEMDPISASVAKALHGDRHEVVNASLERFATQSGGRRFKAVIGNAPFGIRGGMLKDDKRDLKTAEAYFMDTALDLTEAGGVVALIVPTGLMDAKSQRKTRERLMRKGEFIGAVRLPNTAFEHSHTSVTSDIVFFRKRPEDLAGALMTVDQATLKKLGVWDEEYLSGSYFEARGATNVLGTMEPGWRAKAGMGQDITVSGSMAGVPAAISEWSPESHGLQALSVADVVEALGDDQTAVKRAMGGAMVRPYAAGKVGDTKVEDGVTYVLQGTPPRWHRVDEVMEHEAVRDAKPIADQIERAMSGQPVDHEALTAAIQSYIGTHGIPAKSKHLNAAAAHDKVLHRLIGAVGKDGRLSDLVTGRQAQRAVGSLETAAAMLAAERDDGAFTVGDLAERSGKDAAEVDEALHASTAYAYLGAGRWSTMDDYLTGELWPKLDAARAALEQPDLEAGAREKFKLQARRLEEVIAPKSLEDVEIQLNSAFLPTSVLEAWLQSKVDQYRADNPNSDYARNLDAPSVKFDKGVYKISGGLWGDGDLLEKYLNRTGVRKDDMPRVDAMNDEFRQWLLTSSRRDEVEDLYNRKFRGFVQRDWSDAPIEIPGLKTADLNAYHYSSLRWALHAGKGIIADDVGLGKSVRGLMLARLAKMSGKAQKPTFVVPKSVLANWVAEAENWFPGSRVLVIGETYTRDKSGTLRSKPDTKAERDRKYHELSQNDYDFVFISQPAFNDLDVDPITKGTYVNDDFWVQRGDSLGNAGDKKLNRVREAYKQAVANREFEKRTDAIYFNDLGIDMLIADEAHGYKGLYAARARYGESPRFLGGSGQSNRAFDMSFKSRWVREQTGGKGVYMLTATPTKNSPLEVYSMLSYIAPEEFERIGIRNSEEFLDRYCVFKTEKILGTNGAIEDALVTTGFKNLDELREIMDRYIMRRTAKDVGLKLPEAKDEMHLIDMTPEQAGVYGELRALLAESSKKDATGDAHVFSIMDKMAKAAMDLELLGGDYAGSKSPKYEAVAKAAREGSKEGGQIIFCESVASHEKIAQALVAQGLPRARIGIMNADEADSSAKRQNLADDFNSGKLDVIIGNKTMEEGVNLQKRTTDIHHLDMPWNAAALQQRNGRGVRQGNRNEAIGVHTYLARGSFDGYRYQSMRAKKDWSDMLWNGGDRVENLAREGTFNREDLMVMMSADPEAEREKLENDKAAALERHNAEKRVEASEQFVRFQDLKRSFKALKNKDTASAHRLRAQIEKAKTGLAHNPHFAAKGALDRNDEVLIHPATGSIVTRDMGLEVQELSGTKERWVVTGVNPLDRTVSMRRYADTTGHKGVTVPLSKLEKGVSEFKLDKEAEASEVASAMEAAAKAKLDNLSSYKDAMAMPAHVLSANHDLIQRQLKEAAKTYKLHDLPHGSTPMVNRETGKIEMIGSYSARDSGDTHDFMLPTDENREKATQAWIDARRGAKITTKHTPAARKNQQGKWTPAREYPGADYNSKHVNPFTSVLNGLSGHTGGYGSNADGPLVKEAKKRMEAEQYQRIKEAPSFKQALDEAMVLASPTGTDDRSTQKARLPEKALAMLWARARRDGILGQTLDTHIDKTSYGSPAKHDNYAYGDTKQSVHHALMNMATVSGRHTLARAIGHAGEKFAPDSPAKADYQAAHKLAEAIPVAYSKNPDAHAHRADAYRLALRAAERGGFAEQTKATVDASGRSGYSYLNHYSSDGKMPLRQYLQEKISHHEAEHAKAKAQAAITKEAA